jgi:hypothetical protein
VIRISRGELAGIHLRAAFLELRVQRAGLGQLLQM